MCFFLAPAAPKISISGTRPAFPGATVCPFRICHMAIDVDNPDYEALLDPGSACRTYIWQRMFRYLLLEEGWSLWECCFPRCEQPGQQLPWCAGPWGSLWAPDGTGAVWSVSSSSRSRSLTLCPRSLCVIMPLPRSTLQLSFPIQVSGTRSTHR